MLGSPAMISIRGAADLELPGQSWPTSSTGRNNSPFFSKNSPEPSGCTDLEILGIAGQFFVPAPWSQHWSVPASAPPPRRGSVLSRSNASSNWIVALAPVKILRNQRVDVGVDGEVPGRVEARRYRKDKRATRTNERANRVQALTIETTILVSTSFLSGWRYGACPKTPRYLAEFHDADLMLFWVAFLTARGERRKTCRNRDWRLV